MQKALERITGLGLWVAAICLFVMTVLILINVSIRFIFGRGLPWSIELSQFLLMWMSFLGTAAVSLKRDHIVADILGLRLSQRGKAVRDVVADVFIVLLLTVLLVKMVPYTVDLAGTSKASPVLLMPQWVMFASFIVGFLLLWVTHLWNVVQGIQGLSKKESN